MLGDTIVTPKDNKAIDEIYYVLRQLALAGKLREQTGTWQERYSVWLSCFDVVMVPRVEGLPEDYQHLLFDWSSVAIPPREEMPTQFAEGDLDAVMHYLTMTMLRLNRLFLLPKEDSERLRSDDLLAYYRVSEAKIALVLAKAEAGDPVAFEILSDMLEQYYNNPTVQMSQIPEPLRQFRKLQPFIVPKRIIGPEGRKESQRQRDAELVKVIFQLVDNGDYFAGRDKRGVKDRKPCAWWIVWQAAKRLGLDISERQMERRWEEALTAGMVLKDGRTKYKWAEQQSRMIDMLDGMELVSAEGAIFYPMKNVTIDVIEHVLKTQSFEEEGLLLNGHEMTDELVDLHRDMEKSVHGMMKFVRRMDGYVSELESLKKLTAKYDNGPQAETSQLVVMKERAEKIAATAQREFEEAKKEYPMLKYIRVSTIPEDPKQLGTAGAIECATLLSRGVTAPLKSRSELRSGLHGGVTNRGQIATTEVHHDATREGPR